MKNETTNRVSAPIINKIRRILIDSLVKEKFTSWEWKLLDNSVMSLANEIYDSAFIDETIKRN